MPQYGSTHAPPHVLHALVARSFLLLSVSHETQLRISEPHSAYPQVKAGPAALGGGPAVGPEAVVQTRADGALMAALVALLPVTTYAAMHWVVLRFPVHLFSVLLLAGGMPLCLALIPGGMWWLAPAVPAPINAGRAGGSIPGDGPSYGSTPYITTPSRGLAGFMRKTILAGALLVALVGFEGRVVFHGFGQYIQLPPPWNWLAVTFALFGCAVMLLLHLTGALGASVDVTVAGSFLLLCTTAGGWISVAWEGKARGRVVLWDWV